MTTVGSPTDTARTHSNTTRNTSSERDAVAPAHVVVLVVVNTIMFSSTFVLHDFCIVVVIVAAVVVVAGGAAAAAAAAAMSLHSLVSSKTIMKTKILIAVRIITVLNNDGHG